MMKQIVKINYKNLYRFIIALFAITIVLRFILINFYMPDYGGIDMNVIYGIQRVIMGEALYQDPQEASYGIIQYTPLFYHISGAAARLFHIKGADVQGVYATARALSLLFNLLTVVMVALIIRFWRYSWTHSFVFAMPVLMILTTHYYVRGDSLHLFCFCAAIYCFTSYLVNRSLVSILMAAFFSGCCIMAKQSGILCIGIVGFYLLFAERKIILALLYGFCSLLFGLMILKLCIEGNWAAFYQNAYLGLKNGVRLDFLYSIFISQFYLDLVPCYFLGGVIVYAAFRYSRDVQFSFIATGAALSFVFAVVTGLKIGSSNNYFTEFLIFVLIALPFLLEQEFNSRKLFSLGKYIVTIKRFALIAFVVLISSKTMGFFTSMYIERRLVSKPEEYRREQMLFSYFMETLKLEKGSYIYFNERNFLDNLFIGYSLMPTKDVVSQVYLNSPATYDYSNFINGMNSGLVQYIVVDAEKNDINRFEKEIPFIHFDPAKFNWLADIGGYSIYKFSDL